MAPTGRVEFFDEMERRGFRLLSEDKPNGDIEHYFSKYCARCGDFIDFTMMDTYDQEVLGLHLSEVVLRDCEHRTWLSAVPDEVQVNGTEDSVVDVRDESRSEQSSTYQPKPSD